MSKFWNFKNIVATDTIPENVELRIEGDIIDDDSVWMYEMMGMTATSPNAFKNELSQHAGKDLTVWINSDGGDVMAATGIYNALQEHKKTGSNITTKVDTRAMSAAVMPFVAGNERLMSPGSYLLIHDPLAALCGMFNTADLDKLKITLDEVKEGIMNAYEIVAGTSRNKLSSMMEDETLMSAKTAIKEGFATSMLYAELDNTQIQNIDFNMNRIKILNSSAEIAKKMLDIKKTNEHRDESEPISDKNLDLALLVEQSQKFRNIRKKINQI